MKVTKIKTEKLSFDSATNDLKKCMAMFSDDAAKHVKALLPKKEKVIVSFELQDANTAMANGIRRCLVDEIFIKSMDFDEHTIDTDDRFILPDYIKKQIELIPIDQDVVDITASINIINNEDDNIYVTTNDIIFLNSKGDKVLDVVENNIRICILRPGRYLNINNITIATGNKLVENTAKFHTLHNVTYRPLETLRKESNTVLRSAIKEFFISYTTYGNFKNPYTPMHLCCDTLTERLNNILDEIKNIKNSDLVYVSDLVLLETTTNTKKIRIKGEYWTIANLLAYYCYTETKGNIKNVSSALIHPEKQIAGINIVHPEFSTVIQNAIKKIIADLKIVRSSFK